MVPQQQETHMTKITVKLSKNGFYFGTVEHTYSTADEARNSNLVAHYAAQGVSVTELHFSKVE
jgi:hypothetical protein